MAKVLIFGRDRLASLAHHYLRFDSSHEVIGFINPKRSLFWKPVPLGEFEELPLIPVDDLENHHPPGSVECFAPFGASSRSRGRETGYDLLKPRGYDFITYRSSHATIALDAVLGENCMVLENATIQPYVQIGDDVMIGVGSHIGHHSSIGDHSWIGPHAVMADGCIIEPHCVFGAHSTMAACRRAKRSTWVQPGTTLHTSTTVEGVYYSPECTRKAGYSRSEIS